MPPHDIDGGPHPYGVGIGGQSPPTPHGGIDGGIDGDIDGGICEDIGEDIGEDIDGGICEDIGDDIDVSPIDGGDIDGGDIDGGDIGSDVTTSVPTSMGDGNASPKKSDGRTCWASASIVFLSLNPCKTPNSKAFMPQHIP